MRTRLFLGSLLLLLVPGLVTGASVAVPDSSRTTGVQASGLGPDPYWPKDGNAGTDALHYSINVSYDFAKKRLSGRTAARMRATRDLRGFSMDLLLKATKVTVDGVPARFRKSSTHELRITPATPIAAGEVFRVVVSYAGRPSRLSYAGQRSWLADRHEVVTMNQPHMAPWWFPSNDHPSDKATYDIKVTAPRAKRVVSNGTMISRKVKGAKATTHWRMRDPMATYLAFFAAGDFTIEKGRSAAGIRYYNAVSKRLPAATRKMALRKLRRTASITDWLQARLGRYPFTSTGGLVTSLDVGFALENQTRPTYGAWIDRDLMVHELAHQWFGDSVSVNRWRDIWLNEGLATYMELDHAEAHGGPSVNSWLHRGYVETCGDVDAPFWRLDLTDPGADNIFDAAVYHRGAMVIAALRNRIGESDLTRVLRTWVSAHHDSNASVPQFEALAEEISGKSLKGFFDAWLRAGKVPAATPANGITRSCPA
ncbi:M1 family metallopeptidase [Nocardioides sp. zg-ZUI104]|uniref:M1 family metallopeptidase n=1 Tax=Nocardioides faecalis TaxID=2803858 RepID=UPI001BCB9971|nr:M1 family metallopeptidase [Nocardioides faecalis]MBS4751314.1 M1 family metallopeptidase [Nocardioides faecalis]